MLRGLVVVIEIAFLVILLRSSFMQYWLSDAQQTVSGWISAVASIPDQQELRALEGRIRPHVAGFTQSQHQYLDTVLDSRASINHFHKFYCENNDLNPYIYGATLRLLCTEIKGTTLLDNVSEK